MHAELMLPVPSMLLLLLVPTVPLLRVVLLSLAGPMPLQAVRTDSLPLATSIFPMPVVLILQPPVIPMSLPRA